MTTTTTKKEKAIEAILNYFEENDDVFTECIEELDSWNGYLGDNRYYEMYMLNVFYNGTEASEVLTRAFYGHDDETFELNDDGTKNFSRSTFNPNREYFYYNGYGNLVSSDFRDYSANLDHWTVEAMSENRQYIDSIDNDATLSELFDALDDAEDDEMVDICDANGYEFTEDGMIF